MIPLRQRLIDDLRIRNYSPRTIEAYVAAVVRLARHFQRSPDQLDVEHLRQFQLHLLEQQVSWSLFNVVVAALRFFYRGLWRYGVTESTWISSKDYSRQLDRREPLKEILVEELRLVTDEEWFAAQEYLAEEVKRFGGRKVRGTLP